MTDRMPPAPALFIDCSLDTFQDGVSFWSRAFGVEPAASTQPDPDYVNLPGAIPGVLVALQRVDDTSRYHIDFGADDVEAEVARMESLGATRVGQVDTWWVMRAPTGHLFCVVQND